MESEPGQPVFHDPTRLWSHIRSRLPDGGIVGISGYGGAGKTTLARALERGAPGIRLVHVDDHLDWPTVTSRNPDGDGIGFDAIRTAHIEPFRSRRRPGDHLIIEGVFLFSPERQAEFDHRIWVDTPVHALNGTGRARNPQNQHLWETVFIPNELDFEGRHQPRHFVDTVYRWLETER